MNYLELINKCLVELNYKQINTFSELVKNEHKKIKNIINLVNTEVCNFDKWNFLLRKATLTLPKNTGEIKNTINGRISSVFVNGIKYNFCEDFEKFLMNCQPPCTYSVFNDKLLFPIFDKDKTIEVIYYTSNTVSDENGDEQMSFVNETDTSLIPMRFTEPLIVYGTCLRLKANPQHVKFSYWLSMYNDALANLRSKNSIDAYLSPSVKLLRY